MPPPIKPVPSRRDIYKKYETQEIGPGGPVSSGPPSPRRSLYDKYSIGAEAPAEDTTATAVAETPSTQGDFMAGLQSSLRQGIPESVGAFLRTVGLDELGQGISDFGTAGAPNLTGRATTLRDIHSIGDIADFLQFQMGSGVGYLLPSFIGGVAGTAATGSPIGGIIGALAPGYILNTGQVQQELEQLGEPDRKGLALLLGVPIAALDAITPADLAQRVINKQIAKAAAGQIAKKAAPGFAKRALKTGLGEAGTEAGQQVLQEVGTRVGTGKPIEPGERAWSALEAGVAGGVTGVAVGGFQRGAKAPPPPPKGGAPTPEQLMERQTKLDELAAQTRTHEENKKAEVVRTFTAVRAWSQATPEERKAAFPGLYEGEYLKSWKELADPSKELLKQSVSIDDTPAAAAAPPTATAGAPGAAVPGGAPVQGAEASPYAGIPKGPPLPDEAAAGQAAFDAAKAQFEARRRPREDVESQVAEQAKAREAAVPTEQPDLTPIEQELERADATRRSDRIIAQAQQEARRADEVERLKGQIETNPGEMTDEQIQDELLREDHWTKLPQDAVAAKVEAIDREIALTTEQKNRAREAGNTEHEIAFSKNIDSLKKTRERVQSVEQKGTTESTGPKKNELYRPNPKTGKLERVSFEDLTPEEQQQHYQGMVNDAVTRDMATPEPQSQMERDKAIVFEDDELTGTVEGERRPISTRRNQELFNDPNLPENVKREILGRNYDILQKLADGNLSEDSPSVIAIWDQIPYIKPEILAQFPHLVANKKRTRLATPTRRLKLNPDSSVVKAAVDEFESETELTDANTRLYQGKGQARLFPSMRGGLYLSHLGSYVRGGGRSMMEYVTRLADKYGLAITLKPAPQGFGEGKKMSLEELKKWYEGFGFKTIANEPEMMRRDPSGTVVSGEGLVSEARGEFEGVEGTPIQPEPEEARQPSLEEQLANSIRAKGGSPTSALKVHAEYLASLIKKSKSEEFTAYYAEIIAEGYTVKELDDAIFRALGGDDLASLAVKQGGKLGAALSKRAFDSLAQLYAQAWGSTVAKEGLQNAIDAIRGTPNGRVNVKIADQSITFEDNGYGMTPSVMSNEFLDIGASYKEGDENTGGFGLAKVVLFQKSKSVQVRSVYRANGRTWIATMEFSGKDWREDNITPPRVVQSTQSDLPTGTTIRITLNPDANFDKYQAMRWVEEAQRYTRTGTINLFEQDWRGEWQDVGLSVAEKKKVAIRPNPIYTDSEPSHTVNVYESVEQKDHGVSGSIEMHLLNNGFYQSSLRVPMKGEGPKFLVADVTPEVDTQDPDYPFTTSREVLKKPLMDSLERLVAGLSHRQAIKLIHKLVNGLKANARIGSTPYRVIDASLEVPTEFLQSLATHPYMEPFVHLVNEHLAKIAALSAANRGLGPIDDIERKYRYYADIEDFEFGGVVVGSKFLGANFTLIGLDKIAKDAGADFEQVRDLEISASNMIVVNPYTMAWEVEEIKGLVDFRTAWVGRMVAVMPHEIAHQRARDEGDTFSAEYTRTNGAVSENLAPVYAIFREFWDTPFEYPTGEPLPTGHKRITTYGDMIVADLQEIKKYVQLNAANAYKSITAAAEAELRGGDDLSGSERNRQGDEGGTGRGPEDGLQSGGPVREGQEGSRGTTQPETPQLPGTPAGNRLAGDLGPANTVVARELREQYKSESDPRAKFSILKKLQKLIQTMGKKATPRKPKAAPGAQPSSEPTTGAEPAPSQSPGSAVVSSPTPQASPVAQSAAPRTDQGNLAEVERQRRVQQIAEQEAARVLDARFQNMEDVASAELDVTGDVAAYSAAMKAILAMKAKAGEELPALRELAVNRITKAEKPVTLGQPTNKMKLEDIKNTITSIKAQLANPNLDPAERAMLVAEQSRLDTARRKRKEKSEGGFLVNPFQRRRVKKMAQAAMTPSQEYMSNKVELDPDTHNPWNWMKRLRALYMGTLRSTAPPNLAVKLYQEKTGVIVGTHRHAGKQMEMMDGTATVAEAWLRGDGPFLPDGQGGFILTGAKSLAAIGEIAQGEIEEFGWLWLASHALEQSALYGRDIGVDLAHAHEIFLKSPQHLHDAVTAANEYHTSLAQYQYLEGLISQQDVLKVAHETAHGPIEHVFNQQLVDQIVQLMAQTGQTAAQAVNSPAIQRILKTELPTRNMFEATIDVTYRVIRAAKMNRFALSLVDMALAEPDLYADMIERVDHKVNVQKQAVNSDRAQAAKAIFSVFGISVSDERAALYANMMGDKGLEIEDNIVQVKRGGTIELWKVDKLLLDSIKSLAPAEFGMLVKGLGKTAHVLRLGIVLDPMFIAMQTAIDQFQGWTNTRYGFIPVWDSFRGWWNLVKNTPMAQEAIRAGGVERSSLRVRTSLQEVMAGPTLPLLKESLHQIRTLHPAKAINILLTPLREATRMGEFIRAIEHGESPVQAAWAARDLLGNYSVEGSWSTVRALHIMSAFSRPALAVVDKTARTIKERPAQWFLRASTLAIGATILYAANDDDEEIQQLRKTPDGQRWFFFRIGDEIVKWRKPYLEGAIFASGIEAALDKMKGENPEAFKLWRKAMLQEVGLNMFPVMGVVAAELWANKSLRTGAPLIPEYEKGLDPEYQTGPYSGSFERAVGEMGGVSPAIMNYLTRSFLGYWGEHVVRGVSAAMDWNATHELPPMVDWPLTQRVIARYPSSNTQAVREFYENATEVDKAAKTLQYVFNHRPDRIGAEIEQHLPQLPLIEIYNDYRQQIADLREAMGQLDEIRDIGPQTRKLYRDGFMRVIIDLAKSANEITRAVNDATEQATIMSNTQPTPSTNRP